ASRISLGDSGCTDQRNRGVAKHHEKMLREFSNNRKDDDRSARMEALKSMRDLAKVDTSNLKKPTGFERLRLSRRGPQSPLSVSLRDDSPADASSDHLKASPKTLFQKPVQKFGRSGSLQSLRILRTKSISSKLKKSPTPEDLHSKRATFSSILKDSKFHQVKPQVGIKESKDVLPVEKLCRYQHCSLNGHHQREPPAKCFA
ncbi:putative calmodulin-binding domain containing protein, partial [Tanacetum coccineum]